MTCYLMKERCWKVPELAQRVKYVHIHLASTSEVFVFTGKDATRTEHAIANADLNKRAFVTINTTDGKTWRFPISSIEHTHTDWMTIHE